VVLFSAYEDRGSEVLDLLRQGVRGLAYKVKGCPPETLLDAIREVRAGRVLIDSDVTSPLSLADALTAQLSPEERELVSRALDRFDQLSAREGEVLSRFAASHSTESIAQAMGLSLKTVENHVSHAYDKLRLTDAPPAWRRQTLLIKACMIHDLRREQVRPRH
jgi:DNA-binding NarL/FixJ family response regulator